MVHRDSHVEVERAYYEVPEEYLQRQVWVRWDGRTVRVFNDRFEQIAIHAKAAPGRFQQLDQTTSRSRLMGVERSAVWLVQSALKVGPQCGAWAQAVLVNRGVEGIRPLCGLRQLVRKHTGAELEKACGQALELGRFHLRELRGILDAAGEQEEAGFLETHPLIRAMTEYGSLFEKMYPKEETVTPKEYHEPELAQNP